RRSLRRLDVANWGMLRNRDTSAVQSAGNRSRNIVLFRVQRIAQCKLNMSLATGQRKTLSIVGGDEQRDDRRILSLAGGRSFKGVTGCQHRDVLQYCRSLLFATTSGCT